MEYLYIFVSYQPFANNIFWPKLRSLFDLSDLVWQSCTKIFIHISNRCKFPLAPIALAISPVHFCPHRLHGVSHVIVLHRSAVAWPLLGLGRRRHTRESVVVLRGRGAVAQRVGLGRQGPVVVHSSAAAAVAVTVSHSGRWSRGRSPVGNPAVLDGTITNAVSVVLLRPGSRGGVGSVDGALVIPGAVFRRRISWGRQYESVVGP